jgi:hypothetical protein
VCLLSINIRIFDKFLLELSCGDVVFFVSISLRFFLHRASEDVGVDVNLFLKDVVCAEVDHLSELIKNLWTNEFLE